MPKQTPRKVVFVTEQDLVDRAVEAISQSNWILGECAHEWTQRYAQGRTDSDFAEMVGVSRQRVNFARRVYERFHGCSPGSKLSWGHYKVALSWPDAEKHLKRAADVDASVKQMEDWRAVECPPPARRPKTQGTAPRRRITEVADSESPQDASPGRAAGEQDTPDRLSQQARAGAGGREGLPATPRPTLRPAPASSDTTRHGEDTQQVNGFGGPGTLFGGVSVGELIASIKQQVAEFEEHASAEDREQLAEQLHEVADSLVPERPATTGETVEQIRSTLDRWDPADELDKAEMAGHLRNLATPLANGTQGGVVPPFGAELDLDWTEQFEGRTWPEIEDEFVRQWNETPGVVKCSFSGMPENLKDEFRERWRSEVWRDLCQQALAKFPLQNRAKMSLRKFLVPTTVDEIVGGIHDFSPGKQSAGEANKSAFDEIRERFGVRNGHVDRNCRGLLRIPGDQDVDERDRAVGEGPLRSVG